MTEEMFQTQSWKSEREEFASDKIFSLTTFVAIVSIYIHFCKNKIVQKSVKP